MALDDFDYLEGLSSGKKGVGPKVIRVQSELEEHPMGDIVSYDSELVYVPRFIEWKMNFKNDIAMLLGLIDGVDKQAVFFKSLLSSATLRVLSEFRPRLIELNNRDK